MMPACPFNMALTYTVHIVCVFFIITPAPINCDANNELNALIDEFWSWRTRTSPEYATKYGLKTNYDDKLEQYTPQEWDKQKGEIQSFLTKAQAIGTNSLDKPGQVNLKILLYLLTTFVDGYKYRFYGASNPVNTMDKPLSEFKNVITGMPTVLHQDFENILARYQSFSVMVDQLIELMKTSIQQKTTDHIASMRKFKTTALDPFTNLLKLTANDTYFYAPFVKLPDTLPPGNKTDLQTRALSIIKNTVFPAVTKFKDFLEQTYMKNLRPSEGVSTLPDGMNYYKACLKWHLSVDLSPQEIFDIGVQEVATIDIKMREVLNKENFKGTVAEFVNSLQQRPELFYKTEDELLNGYTDMIKQKITDRVKELFYPMPDYPVAVLKSDNPQGATARYSEPPVDGSRPGIFWANVANPETKPKYNMMALALHEAIPGHHTQTTFAIANNLPIFRRLIEYRKYYAVPFNWLFFTTYTEGWALYAESLGEELNLYDEPYSLFGRYASDSLRAARLVVDTGLHAFGWSKQRAMDYLTNHTTISASQIENEVNRYIGWPGQACSYKIGELKIRQLRTRAEASLGKRFKLKAFHKVIMDLGPAPLSLLEESVNDWLQAELLNPSTLNATFKTASISLIFTMVMLFVSLCS